MMAQLRLALAVPITGPEPSPAGLGMLGGLTALGWRVQHFRARSCPTQTTTIRQVTGLPGRHLDAWLMPDAVCRTVFERGLCGADLGLVEGTLAEPDPTRPLDREHYAQPGGLRPLIRALDLPTVALVRCPRREGMHLSALPPGVDAVLIDELEEPGDFERIATAVGVILGKPVLGAVEALPEVRAALAALPRDERVPDEWFAPLTRSFLRFARPEAIRRLAESRPWAGDAEASPCPCEPTFRVAYAQDEVFGGYFPDTLETLETLGADLVAFSPLRSEGLPSAVDLVMIGCGYPDRFADALMANVSLTAALRCHFYGGGRIYSEGGGTAYLGRSFRFDGREVAGVGLLPIDAVRRDDPPPPYPVTITLRADTWLGPAGAEVRGYNAGRWDLHETSELCECAAGHGPIADGCDVFYHKQAVGSLIHLHLAALPEVVAAFAGPHPIPLTRRRANR